MQKKRAMGLDNATIEKKCDPGKKDIGNIMKKNVFQLLI